MDKKRGLVSVGDVLDKLKRESPLGDQLEQARVWRHWPELVGPVLMHHCRPQGLREGVLRVEVDAPVWLHQVSYEKYKIMRRINRLARKRLVEDIFVVLLRDDDTLEADSDGEA